MVTYMHKLDFERRIAQFLSIDCTLSAFWVVDMKLLRLFNQGYM
jgi:hypothetical protein